MKSKAVALMAMAMMMDPMMGAGHSTRYTPPKSKEQIERERQQAIRKQNINKGLTEYHFNEGSLWALNEKSATKKAKKKGWI